MNIRTLIASAERELQMRRKVYPKRVADGKMQPASADHEIKAQELIIETLTKVNEMLNAKTKEAKLPPYRWLETLKDGESTPRQENLFPEKGGNYADG